MRIIFNYNYFPPSSVRYTVGTIILRVTRAYDDVRDS